MGTIYDSLFSRPIEDPGVFVLLDPDRVGRSDLPRLVSSLSTHERVKAILVGTSFLMSSDFCEFVGEVKGSASMPVLIFPGSSQQVCKEADAILFLSLLTGRNPEYLIGEHVRSAPTIRKYGIETIATGYLLIGIDQDLSVVIMSNTRPLPPDKVDLIVAHAMAAELLGFKVLYLEAGSGARAPVPPSTIRAVREGVSLPLIVGGGLRSKGAIDAAFEAGANYAVIGTALERDTGALESLLSN